MNQVHMTNALRKVLILETQIKQYRQPLFMGLSEALATSNIQLKVAYSRATESEGRKSDNVDLPPPIGIEVPALSILNDKVILQRTLKPIMDADLIVLTQENRLLLNYLVLTLRQLGIKKVAFWGHGDNRQRLSVGPSAWLKRRLLDKVDWWFSYTPGVTRYLTSSGFASNKISTLYNTVDTSSLCDPLSSGVLEQARNDLNLSRHALVGLYAGRLTADKEFEFLLESCRRVREDLPDLHLLLMGDGPMG